MNEKIQEIARQSGGIDMTNNVAGGITVWLGTGTPEFLEKFAESIVRECAEISKKYAGGSMPLSIALAIKEHFGVK